MINNLHLGCCYNAGCLCGFNGFLLQELLLSVYRSGLFSDSILMTLGESEPHFTVETVFATPSSELMD